MAHKKQPYVHEGPMTYDEYAALPDDGFRYELVEQRLELMTPAPSTIHQLFITALMRVLSQTCAMEYLLIQSPVDVVFSDDDTRQPDLIMVHRDRMDIVKVRGIFGVPDLIMEVLSPGSFRRDRKDKLATYTKYKVPEYWLADPVNATLEQFVFMDNQLVLSAIYEGDERIHSERISCADFTMTDLVRTIPRLSE